MRFVLVLLSVLWSVQFSFSSDTTRVLFVGNSLTYYNDMPQTFQSISNSLGHSVYIETHTPGGTGFANHVVNPQVYTLFKKGGWDAVVLQPGTGDSAGESFGGSPKALSVERIKLLRDSIYKYNPCCHIFFYEISNGVYGNSQDDLNVYNQVMDTIRSNIQYFSEATQIPFSPVGEAFRTQWNSDLNTMLWNSYGDVHPNAKGSYLAACVFYTSIFRQPSLGADYFDSLSQEQAEGFQALADELVLSNLQMWNISVFDLDPNFEFTEEGNVFTFYNLSQNADSVLWDFDDETFSSEENPSHTFSETGSYNVTLTAYRNGCSESFTRPLTYVFNGILKVFQDESIKIYPNPISQGKDIKIEIPLNNSSLSQNLEVLDLSGRLVKRQRITQRQFYLSTLSLEKGIYILKIGLFTQEFVIN